MHRLDGPAALDEPGCQIIEQLRMCRSGSALAEVARCDDQALAEMILPDAIDHAPRRQRIRRVGDPLGEFEASATLKLRSLLRIEDLQESARRFVAEILRFTALLDAGVTRTAFRNRVGP